MANPHLPVSASTYVHKRVYKIESEMEEEKEREGEREEWESVCLVGCCLLCSFRDLQLMKLGCSRVACQINMSLSPTLFLPPPLCLVYLVSFLSLSVFFPVPTNPSVEFYSSIHSSLSISKLRVFLLIFSPNISALWMTCPYDFVSLEFLFFPLFIHCKICIRMRVY